MNRIIFDAKTKLQNLGEKIFKEKYIWPNLTVFTILHLAFIVGSINFLTFRLNFSLIIFNFFYGVHIGFAVTAGTHRLWAHGSYKANLPLRLFLTFWQTAAFQKSIYKWVRDHRLHHKFTDTNADPHNSLRGFFFSHIGWLLCEKHPDVIKFGKKIDLSDLERDPIVMFQHKYYYMLMPFCCWIIPIYIPTLWGISVYDSTIISCVRYIVTLHFTLLVNSYAHFWGNKPYDKNLTSTESYTVSMLAFGE
ncbi:putative Delta-9 desaturase-like 1 protein, partial [Polypedilum vanderplanki]